MNLIILFQNQKNISERSKYLIDLLFSGILGLKLEIDYIIMGEREYFSSPHFFFNNHKTVILFWGYTPEEAQIIEQNNSSIRNNTILLYRSENTILNDGTFPKIILERKITPEELFSDNDHIDYLSSIFFLISEFECYNPNFPKDKHNRINESETLAIKNEWYKLPYVEIIAEKIKALLIEKNPHFKSIITKNEVKKIITIDIDHPFRYLHKPVYITIPGLIREGLNFNFTRLKVLFNRQDPFNVYHKINELFLADQIIYFILLNGASKYDDYFTSKNKAFIKLIKQLSQTGSEIGIHPSYESYLNYNKIKSEKEVLEDIIGKKIISSRQHFLRYKLPDTYQFLEELGIINEYTTCYSKYNGFKYGMIRPFYWYNLKEERKSNLILHPTILMDRSFLNQHKDVETSIIETQFLWDIIQDKGGNFISLLHNDSLSETGEWKNWSKFWKFLSNM